MWMNKKGLMKTFTFDAYTDDPQNGRCVFIDNDKDKVLTLFYSDISYMITAPYEPHKVLD